MGMGSTGYASKDRDRRFLERERERERLRKLTICVEVSRAAMLQRHGHDMAMTKRVASEHESQGLQIKHSTHPCPQASACAFFDRFVHAAYFQVYNVRGDFGIVWIYGIFAVGIFRLQGNVNKAARQKKAYEYKRTGSDLG